MNGDSCARRGRSRSNQPADWPTLATATSREQEAAEGGGGGGVAAGRSRRQPASAAAIRGLGTLYRRPAQLPPPRLAAARLDEPRLVLMSRGWS